MQIRLKTALLFAALLGVGVTSVDSTQAVEKDKTRPVSQKQKTKPTILKACSCVVVAARLSRNRIGAPRSTVAG